MRKVLIYILIFIATCFVFFGGYTVGYNKLYNGRIKLPIVNKLYFDNEQIEIREGGPISEYSATYCFLNKVYDPERPSKYFCEDMVLDNYRYIEQECIKKVYEKLSEQK